MFDVARISIQVEGEIVSTSTVLDNTGFSQKIQAACEYPQAEWVIVEVDVKVLTSTFTSVTYFHIEDGIVSVYPNQVIESNSLDGWRPEPFDWLNLYNILLHRPSWAEYVISVARSVVSTGVEIPNGDIDDSWIRIGYEADLTPDKCILKALKDRA